MKEEIVQLFIFFSVCWVISILSNILLRKRVPEWYGNIFYMTVVEVTLLLALIGSI